MSDFAEATAGRGARAGVLIDRPEVVISDTRELAWALAPEVAAGALRKQLGGGPGEPTAELLFLPGGAIPEGGGAPLGGSGVEELVVTLAGELGAPADDAPGAVAGMSVALRPGVAVHRPAGAPSGLAAAPVPPCGWIGLVVRCPLAAAGSVTPSPAAAPPAGTVVDSRAADWTPLPYGDFPTAQHKVLARYPGGDVKLQLLFFPPGLDPDRSEFPLYPPVLRATRHHHHRLLELLYVVDGEMPLSEWTSAEQQAGELVWWREGVFVYRRPASIHGAEPGATSVTGATILHFRLGGDETPDGPAFPEPTAIDVPFASS